MKRNEIDSLEAEDGLRRPSVLLIAYGCEPGMGSEPGTGWNMALGLAREFDVTVATRVNNREVIERFLESHSGPKPRFIYVEPPRWALALKKRRILPVQVFYALWQWQLARELKEARRLGGGFDLIHQLTFNSFEMPPLAFFGSKAIKVWGPIGGGQSVPFGFLSSFGLIGGIKEGIRNFRVKISAWSPFCRSVLRRCSLVLFANEETQKLLSGACTAKTGMMIDVGVDISKFAAADRASTNDGKIILCAGRLEGRKGTMLLLEAFEKLVASQEGLQLRIVGDGPRRDVLEKYMRDRGLSERVVFTGPLAHGLMAKELADAAIFVFPSLRDTSGTIVLEAMSTCLPVVCFDHQGARIMVGEEGGLTVEASSRTAAVDGLRDAMSTLLADEQMAWSIGTKSRELVMAQHDWASKVERISAYYRELFEDASSNKKPTVPSA